jgi:hypothetical protein
MKTLKIFLIACVAVLSITAHAQTTQKLYLDNYNGNVFRYGQQAILTTTDSVVTTISTVTVAAEEVGILQIDVVGFNDSLGIGVTGTKIVRYAKHGGTLTLGTPTSILTSATDTGLGTATWSVTTSSNNIIVTVKGKDTYTVKWIANIRKINRT